MDNEMQLNRIFTLSLILIVLLPVAAGAVTEADPMLTSYGAMLILIPIACMAAAIFLALVCKKPVSYQGSYDILKKRRFASETKKGFFERMCDELKDDVKL